ncbi:MAG: FAD-binding oxidoreductase, partial [Microbacterium sp.]
VEVRLLGGATQAAVGEANAVAGRDGAYSLHIVGAPVPELLDEVVPGAIAAVFDALGPWRASGLLPNFVGPANASDSASQTWPAETARRLSAVRASYDPFGLFA